MTPPSNAGGEGREVLFVLFYQPPNGRWYVHSHKLYRTHLDAVAAAAEFLHPGTPIAAVPFDTNLLAFSARENADDRAAYTYDVTWSRADAERLTCRDLSPRLVTARIIQAIKTSGPITIHAVEGRADDRAPALVKAAVAEMRERAAKVADEAARLLNLVGRRAYKDGHLELSQACREREPTAEGIATAIRALPTPSQEASNVG